MKKPNFEPTRTYRPAAAVTLALSALVGGALSLAPSPARAQSPNPSYSMVLLPPAGTNVGSNILEAARNILKDHLQRTGRYTVIVAGGPPTYEEPSPAQAVAIAAPLGGSQATVLQITHLGSTARARMTVYAVGTGQVTYWDSIPITGGPDELDVALERLVRALVVGKPVRDSADIETVTQKETQFLNRRHANKSFGIRLFAMTPFNAPDQQYDPVSGFGVFWMYDARSWIADVSFDLGFREQAYAVFDVSLGAYYPFSREDFTPYIGGAVKWSSMQLGGVEGAQGLTLQPTLGILLGRLSTVQIRGEVGYFFNTYGEREQRIATSTGTAEPKHFNHGLMISAGLGF
jgi:hypothetical protein